MAYMCHIWLIYYDIPVYEMSQFHIYHICQHIYNTYINIYAPYICTHICWHICYSWHIYDIYVIFYMWHIWLFRMERLKIQTSNLVCRLMTRGTIRKFEKLGQMGKRPGSRELLLNFGTPSISKERLKIQTSNLVCRLITRGTIRKFEKNLVKWENGPGHLTYF